MIKKKILIVCKGFYPQNHPRAFRATELAKEFALQGHDVTVLTPKDDQFHLAFEQEHSLKIKDLGTPRWKSPNYGTSKVGYILTRVFFRLLNLAFEYPDIELMFLTAKALRKERDYDLLISIAVPYPIHWGVAKAWKRNQRIAKTWVADCGDPYVGCTTDSFRKWFYWSWVEKWFMKKADFIAITNINFKINYFPEFHKKMVEIPQGFNFDEIKLTLNTFPIKNEIPHFAFAGSLIPRYRDPSKLLSYLISLKSNYKFILYTKSTNMVEPFSIKSNGRIEIRDYIPRKELLKELSKMNFLVNFEFDPQVQSPSKLIDYAITGKPILNVISKNFYPSTVDEFLKGNYNNQFIVPNIEQYKIENVCQAFLNLHDADDK